MNRPMAVRLGRTARTRSSSLILGAQDFSFLICINMFSIFNLQHNFSFACTSFNLQGAGWREPWERGCVLGSEILVKSRSVKRNAKNSRRLGRDRAAEPVRIFLTACSGI